MRHTKLAIFIILLLLNFVQTLVTAADIVEVRGVEAGTTGAVEKVEVRGSVATADAQWNAQNFAGFYYDFKDDIGTETLSTTLTDNKLSGDSPYGLRYETAAQPKKFEYEEWGSYNIIGFLGRSFLVSYLEDSPLQHASKDFNLLGDSRLGRVLIDSVERQTIPNNGTLSLQDGLEAKLFIDKSCNKTLVELYRNGTIVDSVNGGAKSAQS